MKRKSDRQKLILANDKIFRQIILLRDRVCQKTGKTTNLQVCHFYTRSKLNVRWNLLNACLLNAGTHLYWAHKNPQEFREFWMKRLGPLDFQALELKARYVQPIKMEFLYLTNFLLKKELSTLQKEDSRV